MRGKSEEGEKTGREGGGGGGGGGGRIVAAELNYVCEIATLEISPGRRDLIDNRRAAGGP